MRRSGRSSGVGETQRGFLVASAGARRAGVARYRRGGHEREVRRVAVYTIGDNAAGAGRPVVQRQ